MNHEFSVNEMDENGHIPVCGDKAADIVGATIKFHFNDMNGYKTFEGRISLAGGW